MNLEEIMNDMKDNKICRMEQMHEVLQNLCFHNSEEEEESLYSGDQGAKKLAELALLEDVAFSGNSGAIHNVAVQYARNNYFDLACCILQKGLANKKDSMDPDLLADYLEYSINAMDNAFEKAEEYFERLKRINKKRWTWRVYDFSLDYLIKCMDVSPESYEEIMEECYALAEGFKESAEDTEYADNAYSALADIHLKNGDKKRWELTLKEATEKVKKTPLCSLQLADSYYKRGLYDEALKYIKKCISENNNAEENVNIGYPHILFALCMISEFYSNIENDKLDDKENYKKRIKEIEKEYDQAKTSLGTRDGRVVTLQKRIELLKKRMEDNYDDIKNYEE